MRLQRFSAIHVFSRSPEFQTLQKKLNSVRAQCISHEAIPVSGECVASYVAGRMRLRSLKATCFYRSERQQPEANKCEQIYLSIDHGTDNNTTHNTYECLIN